MRKDFYIRSADGVTKLHCVWWKPEGEVRAVVQLVHGMVEHIGRYEEFALFLNRKGFAVIGYDQLGHGASVQTPEDRGFFAEKGGLNILLKDAHHVTRLARAAYPDRKLFLFGHSMGSFLVRRYITIWGSDVDGLIAMGTGHHDRLAAGFAKFLTKLYIEFSGPRCRSRLIGLTATGGYDLTYKLNGKGSWLSKNGESVAAYASDPRCGFIFTAEGFHVLFTLVEQLACRTDQERIPKDLPVFFVSGMDDLCGGCTKGPLTAYNELVELGIRDLNIKFYENDRHELLQELDREVVFADLAHWMEERIG